MKEDLKGLFHPNRGVYSPLYSPFAITELRLDFD